MTAEKWLHRFHVYFTMRYAPSDFSYVCPLRPREQRHRAEAKTEGHKGGKRIKNTKGGEKNFS
jgi:hypothetical protein